MEIKERKPCKRNKESTNGRDSRAQLRSKRRSK